jgi:hypothetical protein
MSNLLFSNYFNTNRNEAPLPLYETMGLEKNALALLSAINITDKLVKRGEAMMKISEILNHSTPFMINNFIKSFNVAITEGDIVHDRGEEPANSRE